VRRSQAVLFHAPVERGAGEAEFGRCAGDVPGVFLQGAFDQSAFGVFEVHVGGFGRWYGGGGAGAVAGEGEVFGGEGGGAGEDDGALGGVAERADIAGPVVGGEGFEEGWRQGGEGLAIFAGVERQIVGAAWVDSKYGLVPVTIVGVVPDARFRSFREPYEAIVYSLDATVANEMVIRLKAGEAGAVRDRVEAIWKRYAGQVPFEAEFADAIVGRQYDADEARAQIFALFAGLAIIVACLGLYGLATFTAERRTREIGIRKVLGATDRDIVRLLVWQFSRPVLLANLIAWPVAWWLMREWLDGFTARIALGPQWFLLAGGVAALIAAVTIGGHALKVARASPAAALRYE